MVKPLEALNQAAKALGIPADWLDKLIAFESGWNPVAMNPKTSAKGLIQFVDSVARELGYTNSYDLIMKNQDAGKQLRGPVVEYLQKYAPYPTKQSLYMAVIYPAARYWDANKLFPPVTQNGKKVSFDTLNPGIKTPLDYINKVEGIKVKVASAISATLLLIGSVVYLMMKR
jgi:hypothetical protein